MRVSSLPLLACGVACLPFAPVPSAHGDEPRPDKTPVTKPELPVSAQQAAWEAQIPERLRVRAKHEPRMAAAFAFVQDDPPLPRVLLIGDSISILYTPFVRQMLAKEANVHRIPDNGASTKHGLEKIDEWLGSGRWDVIHFNWGLHDLVINSKGLLAVPLEQYEKNLESLIARLQKTGAALIFATTTPVPEGEKGRQAGHEKRYNEVATRVMARHHIPVNDLCTAIQPHLAEYQAPNDVHFGDAGSQFLAQRLVPLIRQALKERKKP